MRQLASGLNHHWLWVLAAVFLAAGLYVIFVAFAPALGSPMITGRAADATKKLLQDTPGSHGDRLYIPQINVDVSVVQGTDESALEKGAWHRKPENGNPRDGGNFVLSAHRFVMSFTPQGTAVKSPFYHIDKLKLGDILTVDYDGKRYDYEITRMYTVKPTDIGIEDRSPDAKMTLYSCTLSGEKDGREVIEARPAKTD